MRRRPDDFLGAGDVGDAGQLHEDLIGGAVARDDRLGDAQLVDAALDGLQRLVDRVLAQLHGDVRPHREGVAARAGGAVVVRLELGQQRARNAAS